MTSERKVYVYIQLPDEQRIVPCGVFVHAEGRAGPYGRFAYAGSYRERSEAVPLDPIALPVQGRTFETTEFAGLFSVLRDAAPDAWGRYVIDKREGRTGFDDLDYLLLASGERPGALFFSSTADEPPEPGTPLLDLEKIQWALRHLERAAPGQPIPEEVRQIARHGSSLGGARPKAEVVLDGRHWVAKFSRERDRFRYAVAERAMLELAHRNGIQVPEARLEKVAGEDVLLIERFDRRTSADGWLRHRVASAVTALRASDSPTDRERWSYPLLADEIQRWSREPERNQRELFRRMVFAALISNTDDHPRNHCLVAPGRHWRLSPAYDLLPFPEVSEEARHLAMEVGEFGRLARRDNILSQAPRFGFELAVAEQVIDEMVEGVREGWELALRDFGASEGEIELLRPAFLYPGFDYPSLS